jgi:actin-related protein
MDECVACLTKPVVEPARLLRVPGLIAAAILIFCVPAYVQNTSADAGLSAGELLRRVVNSELKAQANDHSHWMYKVKAGVPGREQVKVAVQTREGYLDRLRFVNGQPITTEQEKQEDQRIARLLRKPDEQKKQRRAQEQDARQTEQLLKMLPDAVTASYGKRQGELVEILFEPNPNFHPSSHQAAVFHAMAGRIWINTRENRLVEIEGHLTRGVKFGGGLLGHLDKGGEFHVKQSEVAPGYWEITLLHVNMHGKALFFKTIAVQENEIRTNFQRVPDNLTLAEAAGQLQRQSTVKSASVSGATTVQAISHSRSSSH